MPWIKLSYSSVKCNYRAKKVAIEIANLRLRMHHKLNARYFLLRNDSKNSTEYQKTNESLGGLTDHEPDP